MQFLVILQNGLSLPEPAPLPNSMWMYRLLGILAMAYIVKLIWFITKSARSSFRSALLEENAYSIHLFFSALIFLTGLLCLSFDCRDLLRYSSRFGMPAFEAVTGDLSRSFLAFGYSILASIALLLLHGFKTMIRGILMKKSQGPSA